MTNNVTGRCTCIGVLFPSGQISVSSLFQEDQYVFWDCSLFGNLFGDLFGNLLGDSCGIRRAQPTEGLGEGVSVRPHPHPEESDHEIFF